MWVYFVYTLIAEATYLTNLDVVFTLDKFKLEEGLMPMIRLLKWDKKLLTNQPTQIKMK